MQNTNSYRFETRRKRGGGSAAALGVALAELHGEALELHEMPVEAADKIMDEFESMGYVVGYAGRGFVIGDQDALLDLLIAAERCCTKAKLLYDGAAAERGETPSENECWAEFEALSSAVSEFRFT